MRCLDHDPTSQGTNTSEFGKRNIIFNNTLGGDLFVSRRVSIIINHATIVHKCGLIVYFSNQYDSIYCSLRFRDSK